MQKIKLNGSFGEKEIFLEIGKTSIKNNNVVINIHGAFGKINEKYRKFGDNLLENNNTNTVLYSSSRLKNDFENSNLSEFEKKQKLFEGKILKDEIEDGKIVINYILENSGELFGIKKEDIILTINGNSLGGIISLYLAENFNNIKNINIVGTGTNLDIKGTSLLDSYPDLIELQRICEKFSGNILLNYATQDIIFTQDSYNLFYSLLKNANKSKIKFIGVDHSFKKINGEKSNLPYIQIYKNIVELIKGNLVSGEIDFLSMIKKENIEISDDLLKKYFKKDKEGFWE